MYQITGYDYAQWQYDNQTGPNPFGRTAKCCCCRDDVPESEIVKISGEYICNDCFRDYCSRYINDYGVDFIAGNEEDFYMDWWFNNLPKADKIKALKEAYSQQKSRADMLGNPEFKDMETEFCRESDGFQDFVRERLG